MADVRDEMRPQEVNTEQVEIPTLVKPEVIIDEEIVDLYAAELLN